MQKPTFVLFLFLVSAMAQAQIDSTDGFFNKLDFWNDERPGTLVIHEEEKITSLMETIADTDIPLDGFRIQLSFGRKEEVNNIRVEFLQKYPESRAYVSWLQPNFRLRVGDFRTRLQAERFKNEIQEDYPGCYIVRDNIEPVAHD